MKIFITIFFTIAVAIFTGCDSSATSKSAETHAIEITDFLERTIKLKKPAERIVLLRGRDLYELSMLIGTEITRKVIAMGPDLRQADAGAYNQFCKHLPKVKNIPELGSIYQDAIKAEQLLLMKPDLVVAETFMKERDYGCLKQIEALGLPIVYLDFSHDPFSSPQKSMTMLGKLLGKKKRAAEIVNFVNRELQKTFAVINKADSGPNCYVECANSALVPGNSYGEGYNGRTMSWGTFIKKAGLNNIAGKIGLMTQLNQEVVLKQDPELILLSGAGWLKKNDSLLLGYGIAPDTAQRRLKLFTNRPGWKQLKAVKNGRIYGLFHGFCMHPDNFVALQQLVKWTYPKLGSKLEPEAAFNEFHRRFLPIPAEGVWMVKLEID